MNLMHDRMSEDEAKVAHFKKMVGVAKCIMGHPPSCLPELLLHWSFEVRSWHYIDENSPTRTELDEASAKFRQLASALWEHMKTTALAGFLASTSIAQNEKSFYELEDNLLQYMVEAAEFERSALMVRTDGKMVPGASRPLLPGTVTAKYGCAAIIAEVFSFFVERGLPSPSLRMSYKAAEQYWMSWPLGTERIRSDPATRGRDISRAVTTSELSVCERR
jgi:hypothetical protein